MRSSSLLLLMHEILLLLVLLKQLGVACWHWHHAHHWWVLSHRVRGKTSSTGGRELLVSWRHLLWWLHHVRWVIVAAHWHHLLLRVRLSRVLLVASCWVVTANRRWVHLTTWHERRWIYTRLGSSWISATSITWRSALLRHKTATAGLLLHLIELLVKFTAF